MYHLIAKNTDYGCFVHMKNMFIQFWGFFQVFFMLE